MTSGDHGFTALRGSRGCLRLRTCIGGLGLVEVVMLLTMYMLCSSYLSMGVLRIRWR
jgi:hypothetical protein